MSNQIINANNKSLKENNMGNLSKEQLTTVMSKLADQLSATIDDMRNLYRDCSASEKKEWIFLSKNYVIRKSKAAWDKLIGFVMYVYNKLVDGYNYLCNKVKKVKAAWSSLI